jgi:hypothetical protein
MVDNPHKFKVGQTVELVATSFRSAESGHYEIVGLRPVEDADSNPLYRVKSKGEAHERVVAESDLIPVGGSPSQD